MGGRCGVDLGAAPRGSPGLIRLSEVNPPCQALLKRQRVGRVLHRPGGLGPLSRRLSSSPTRYCIQAVGALSQKWRVKEDHPRSWGGHLHLKGVSPAYVSLNVSAPKNYLEEGERIGDMETPWPASGSTSYNMQCQFNKDIKLQPTTENITHP